MTRSQVRAPHATSQPSGASAIAVADLDDGRVSLAGAALAQLAAAGGGRLLQPGDAGWTDAVRLWNRMAAREPALVLQPGSTREVAAAVTFAHEHRLSLGVKGGGHHIAGTAIAEGGLLLDMSRMSSVTVDPARRTADVGPGCRLRDVDRATQQHGLATPLGFVSDTGVAGLTLGGGLGYLTRRFGWTVDNLLEVEIVTADGRVRIASREREPDLFWAVRGAGANFGVVTRFTYRLHEVGANVYGGLVGWPFERAAEVVAAYRALTAHAPRELAVWLVLLHGPPAPFVPEAWRGRKLCAMSVCYTGDPAALEAAIAPLRALGEPVFDLLTARPYAEQQSLLDATEPSGIDHYWKTEFVAELGDDLLVTLVDIFAACDVPEGEIGILHLGGALNERAEDDGAVGNRDARFAIGVKAMWPPGDDHAEEIVRWVRAGWQRVRPFSTGRTYINFQGADENEERVQATYGRNYQRLMALKAKHDPENLFRSNRNIRPA
jgi:FAD/FMN-containing dehydrogenase